MMSQTTRKITKKVCVLGDPAVGKTSLIRRYVSNAFDEKYLTTIGANIVKKDMEIPAEDEQRAMDLTLMIWDLAGHRAWNSIKQAYYQGTEGAMIVCDITRRETLSTTIDWIKSLMEVTGDIPFILMANKSDLRDEAMFDHAELQEVADVTRSPFLLTSAKNGRNVAEAFDLLSRMLAAKIQ